MKKLKEFELFKLKNNALAIADFYCDFLEKGGVDYGARQKRAAIKNANLKIAKMIKWQFLDNARFLEILAAINFKFQKGIESPAAAAMRIFEDYFSLAIADLSIQVENLDAPARRAFQKIYDNAPFLIEKFKVRMAQNHKIKELQ